MRVVGRRAAGVVHGRIGDRDSRNDGVRRDRGSRRRRFGAPDSGHRHSRRESRADGRIHFGSARHRVRVDHRDAAARAPDRCKATRRNGDHRSSTQRAVVPPNDAAREPGRSQGNELRVSGRRERNPDAARSRRGSDADPDAVRCRSRSTWRRSGRGSASVQLLVQRRQGGAGFRRPQARNGVRVGPRDHQRHRRRDEPRPQRVDTGTGARARRYSSPRPAAVASSHQATFRRSSRVLSTSSVRSECCRAK